MDVNNEIPTAYLLEWLKSKTWQHARLERMWNKRNAHLSVVVIQNGTGTLADSMALSYKAKHSFKIRSNMIMYGYESWTVKKAERRRIDAFELWCWRRLLRVPWTARRSNQFILKELNLNIHWKDWCWNWNSNTLATWCKELTHWKRPWCRRRLKAGGERENRGWDGWMASLTQWIWVWASSGRWWRTGKPGVLQPIGLK